ncbi:MULTISPECIES: alpha/beta fold hydrolase [Bacillus]|uniref:alpha/beta fold hydrolase n=1 Tax=Bacillus TaxID=1386 RepID=UPI000532BD81|nr:MULTISPECIES: alpha/beta hydrolase [Bacillus]KMO07409.1 2-hydroxy-6-oxo-6-phenylhexa-2,4-dienoate hydrolase [Bacillus amyloliquefaciens]MDE5155459.1 alpha/beta hydrolase [Bacillus amyloliquefaciens]QGU46379.1 alpha/beta fold hydrolase [Bacillus velezensis]RBZ01947.1 alpha/beta hydrolase [Bacillus velezensis]UJL68067.1 alpha/beta hydrolase [Bacillus velezensis]
MSIYHKVIGEGYPIVMLHGWTLDHQVMLHAMEPLFEKRSGWKRIYIDLPGMGHSEPQPSIQNSDDILEAILRLLDEIIPGQQFIVCGNSYGGYIARGIVRSRQETVRGLLLMAPLTIPEFDERVVPQKTVLKRDSDLISHLSSEEADEFCSMAIVQGKTEWERFRDEILLPSKQTNYEFINNIRQNGYGFTFDISSKLEYPTLIITGRQDNVVGYHDAWRLIEDYPRATFAVLDMAGHNLQIEQTDLFNSLVHNWLNRLESENFRMV